MQTLKHQYHYYKQLQTFYQVILLNSSQEILYFFPTSHPNGFVDLKITYLGIGTFENETFVQSGTFNSTLKGAFKFEVRNIGTKTSDDWTLEAVLPSGFTYVSDSQAQLRPNETATLTLGFTPEADSSTATISSTVIEENDTKEGNNSFTWSVKITDAETN